MKFTLDLWDEYEETDDSNGIVDDWTMYKILDKNRGELAEATTVERNKTKLLVSVHDELNLRYAIQGNLFVDVVPQAESLLDTLREYARLERDGLIACTPCDCGSIVHFELAPAKGEQPYTTDEELHQLIAERLAVVYGEKPEV